MALDGIDIRTWDLTMLLAAFEASLRKSSKDENEWRRTEAELTAEPREVRAGRRAAGQRNTGGSGRMDVGSAEAMLARFAASEASYG